MAESGEVKKPGTLESLSKKELVGKCKTLLQIARKPKKQKMRYKKKRKCFKKKALKKRRSFRADQCLEI